MKNTPYYESTCDTMANRSIIDEHEAVPYYPAHFHRKIELTYLLEGVCKTAIDGKKYLLEKDDICFIPSYSSHDYATSEDCSRLVSIPNGDVFQTVENALKGKRFPSFVLSDKTYNRQTLLPILQLIHKESGGNFLIQQGLLEYFFGKLIERYPLHSSETPKNLSLKIEILQYVEENFTEPLTLNDLANHFAYSPFHFSKLFNELTGMNLNAYVNRIRIEEFIKVAQKKEFSESNVCHTAFTMGFNSMPTFYRAFKNITGVPPMEYFKKENS